MVRGSVPCLVAALVAAACAGSDPRRERPLEIVIPTDLATLDPRFSTRSLDIKVTRLVHAGLVGLDANTLEPVPLVAESWRFEHDRALEVTLRDVRFHGGRRVEPRDVCATLQALADPTTASPHRAVVRAIGACEPRGARGLVIRLKEPRATLLTDLEVPVLREEDARVAPRPDGRLEGLGPYRIAHVGASEVHLEPAEGALHPPRHAVVVRSVRDENARALRLLAGRTDIAPSAISPALLPALENREDLSVVSRQGANVTYLLFQNDRAPFDRPEVRRAVAHALDRESVVRHLLAGRGRVASAMFPEGHWAHGEAREPIPFDVAAARPVLSALPRVALLTSTDRARVTIARALAQMLGDAGLAVDVVPLDFGVLLARLDAGDFSFATLQMPELTEPNLLKWFFHPRGVPGEGGEGRNRARWRSARAGQWLDTASESRDVAERRRLYTHLAALMADELPVLPLWHEDQVAVVSRRARGFLPSAEGRWLGVSALP